MSKSTPSRRSTSFAPLRNLTLLEELVIKLKGRSPDVPGLGVFHGRSGDGKSRAAAWVGASDHMAYYVEANDFWTPRAMLRAVVDAMGLAPLPHATNNELAAKIAEELETSRRPLIIDEADHLAKKDMIDKVRALHDMAAPGTASIVLIGEEGLPQKLQRYERFHRRVLDFVAAEPCDLDDARQLAGLYCPRVDVADDLLVQLLEQTYRSTGRVAVNLVAISAFAAGEGLRRIDRDAYAGQRINTGAAPAVRRF
ncbi:AAA family ATPase [Azospirillum agricola]|uniref:AAA family ATPase n=1 Tax=Azospirillum agricola TaxID=1720247 RepID=UPI000A0EEF08|nr:ATP-binding protein [Azospirillum agricola]SMH62567.1 AAA domain-containing protein [Azospirillum lipoferum]